MPRMHFNCRREDAAEDLIKEQRSYVFSTAMRRACSMMRF